MKASIVTIGDEILIGQVIDTNSAWISQQVNDIGILVKKTWSVSDDHEEILNVMKQACDETDIVFITGGLGPTKDDITKKALADFLGVGMFFHQETYDRIARIFEKLGRQMSPNHHDQCLMPDGVHILKNSMGTAPGMLFDFNGKKIISMPGVPYEMKAIMNEEVLPLLASLSNKSIVHKTILTSCTGETIIENRIADIIARFPDNLKIAYLPSLAQVRLRLSGTGQNADTLRTLVSAYTDEIAERLRDIVYGYDESSIEKELLQTCKTKQVIVGTAESCTGGLISAKIVSVPGASDYFTGSIIAYSNDIKRSLLRVNNDTLEKHGAVSEETVLAMIDEALNILGTDVVVAVSGIAGPDGGTPEKPVGTIWIGVGNKNNQKTFLLKAGKDRSKNIETASVYALTLMRNFILEQY